MSYPDEIIADTPLGYWRHDEVGSASNGDELSDTSGNNKPVTLCYSNLSGTLLPYGQPSAIETDPASSAIRTFSNNLSHVGSNDRCYAYRADNDFLVPQNLTLECWVSSLVDLPAGGSYPLFGVRGVARLRRAFRSSPGAGEANFYFELAMNIDGTTYTVTAETPVFNNTFYHVVGGRNGTTIFLRINHGFLATETVPGDDNDSGDPAPLSLTPCNPLGNSLVIGGLPFNDIHNDVLLDECAIYDTALTEARILAHYEAAISATLLNGYSNVIGSAILYSDVEPDPVSYPFRHNWVDDHVERISFATGVSTARKGYEQGNAQRIKPRREIEITQVLKDDYERRMFRAKLNANQHRKWWWPILEDRERLNGVVSVGTDTFAVDTLYRDYEIGGYFGIRQLDSTGKITHWEELLITGLTNIEIQTVTQTVNSYTNPEVYPLRRALLSSSQSLRGHTDSVEETTILARLIAEDEKTIPHRIVGWTPTATYKSNEVFPAAQWPNNWTELRDYETVRTGTDVDFDTGSFAEESDAIGASEVFSWRILLITKQQQAEFLGWFYTRAGSLSYLWVPTMQRDFAVVSAVGANLTVEGHNYFDNFAGSEYRRDLAFVYDDNSMLFRRIALVVTAGANETLTLDANVPTLTNLRSVSYLLFCRLDNDTIERASTTDTKARFSWLFREVLSSPT